MAFVTPDFFVPDTQDCIYKLLSLFISSVTYLLGVICLKKGEYKPEFGMVDAFHFCNFVV